MPWYTSNEIEERTEMTSFRTKSSRNVRKQYTVARPFLIFAPKRRTKTNLIWSISGPLTLPDLFPPVLSSSHSRVDLAKSELPRMQVQTLLNVKTWRQRVFTTFIGKNSVTLIVLAIKTFFKRSLSLIACEWSHPTWYRSANQVW